VYPRYQFWQYRHKSEMTDDAFDPELLLESGSGTLAAIVSCASSDIDA